MTIPPIAKAGAIALGVTGVASFGATTYAANGTGPGAGMASAYTSMQTKLIGLGGTLALAGLVAVKGPWKTAATRVGVFGGVTGGLIGGSLIAKGADRVINKGWYDESQRLSDKAVKESVDFYRAHGVTKDGAVDEIPVKIDRTLHNAAFLPIDWRGEQIVIGRYPDGTSFAKSPDVIYHEYGHRVIDHYAPGLQGRGQGGAIGEALADTFANAIDQTNWTVGEGGGEPIRYLDHPEKLKFNVGDGEQPYPSHRSEYVHTEADAGGVHINSTIVSHASYLIGSQIGRDAMGEIYIHALKEGKLNADTNFGDLARAAVDSAGEIWGQNSREQRVTREAWASVGYDT